LEPAPSPTLADYVRVTASTPLRAQLACEAGSLALVACFVEQLLDQVDEDGEALEQVELDARIGEIERALVAAHRVLVALRARRTRPKGSRFH
jgi:hypothetical protein